MPRLPQRSYTPRDFAILRSLFESRLMTRTHIAAIHFDGRPRMTKKRLQRLEADGLVAYRPRQPQQPKLHFLTKKGFNLLLLADGGLPDHLHIGYDSFRRRIDVSELTLKHELAVMDVKAAFHQAVRNEPASTIAEFSTWPRLLRFCVRSTTAKWQSPDAFLRLRETTIEGMTDQLFYLEVDRSTESLVVLQRKAVGYVDHYRSGGMAIRCGGRRDDYKQYGFRVLWVFRNAERRNNAAEAFLTCHPPVLTQAWLTTMQELLADPFGEIWIRPIDYREAVKSTPFDSIAPANRGNYRRSSDREAHVERVIHRQAIRKLPQPGYN